MKSEQSLDLRRLPAIAWLLASLNLSFPAALAYLLRPVILGNASACNWPSIVERSVVSLVFVIGAASLVTKHLRLGTVLTSVGVLLSVLLVAWFWSKSGIRFTLEIKGWLMVDACI